jgi:predicted outer membrane repeat protein
MVKWNLVCFVALLVSLGPNKTAAGLDDRNSDHILNRSPAESRALQQEGEQEEGGALFGIGVLWRALITTVNNVLSTILTGPGRRRFLSCNLGLNICLCNRDDLAAAIRNNQDINICIETTIEFQGDKDDQEIDLTGTSFTIGCDGPPCGFMLLRGQNRFFGGAPARAVFDEVFFRFGHASDDGGAMKLTGGTTTCTNCYFDNTAVRNGGAIAITGAGAKLTLANPVFFSNEAATGSGGAIYVTNNAVVSINGGPPPHDEQDADRYGHTFALNNAQTGGGAIFVDNGGRVELRDSTLHCDNFVPGTSSTSSTAGHNLFIGGGNGSTITCDNVTFAVERGIGGTGTSATCGASTIVKGDGSTTGYPCTT